MRNIAAHYTLRETLGKGASGTVREGVHKKTRQRVAIKTIRIGFKNERELQRMKIVEDLRREVACLKLMCVKNKRVGATAATKSNLLQLVDVYEWRPNSMIHEVHIVTELCSGGDLRRAIDGCKIQCISNGTSGRFSNSVMQGLTRQLLWALKVAHGKGLVHRDVKPDNMVLCGPMNFNRGADDVPRVKLIDMGITISTKELVDRRLKTNVDGFAGTCNYIAPEIVIDRRYSAASDVWAAGVVLYEMACGHLPFTAGSKEDTVAAIRGFGLSKRPISINVRQEWRNDDLPPALVNLLQSMLHPNPKRRLTVIAALKHPWFHGGVLQDDDDEETEYSDSDLSDFEDCIDHDVVVVDCSYDGEWFRIWLSTRSTCVWQPQVHTPAKIVPLPLPDVTPSPLPAVKPSPLPEVTPSLPSPLLETIDYTQPASDQAEEFQKFCLRFSQYGSSA